MSVSSKGAPVMTLQGAYKHFGGVIAAEDVNLDFYGGEILGLIGPNGAGKSTLVNLMTGIYAADRGAVLLQGKDITHMPTHRRARLGVARTFQHPRLLDRCTVRENVLLGLDLANKAGGRGQGKADDQTRAIAHLMEIAGLGDVRLDGPISKLSYGQQKLLELIRALLSDPLVLLLDEPAAGLNNRETEYVVALMRVAVDKGIAVMLIEHSMDLVMSVCDRISVLNFGHQIATGTPQEIQDNPAVIDAYLGGNVHAEG